MLDSPNPQASRPDPHREETPKPEYVMLQTLCGCSQQLRVPRNCEPPEEFAVALGEMIDSQGEMRRPVRTFQKTRATSRDTGALIYRERADGPFANVKPGTQVVDARPGGGNDLETTTLDELLRELRRRTDRGALVVERDSSNGPDADQSSRSLMMWGNAVWGMGAVAWLEKEIREQHRRQLADPDPPGDEGFGIIV